MMSLLPVSLLRFIPVIIGAGGVFIGQRMKVESVDQLSKQAEIAQANNEILKAQTEASRLQGRRVNVHVVEKEESTCECNKQSVVKIG